MSKWLPTWGYVPIDYNREDGFFENITQKIVIVNNLEGDRVKIRLSNRFNENELVIDHARLDIRNRVTGKITSKNAVTYKGSSVLTVPADTEDYSDDIVASVTADDDFIVWMYFKDREMYKSPVVTYASMTWFGMNFTGDYEGAADLGFTFKPVIAPALNEDPYSNNYAVGMSSICVHTSDDAKLVAMFGDSITHMSYYTDPVALGLYERNPGKVSVINAGICGNRIYSTFPDAQMLPGKGHQFGIAGKDRFVYDVSKDAEPDVVFYLIGVNDCSHSIAFGEKYIPTPEDIFGALKKTVDDAEGMGAKTLIGTITPFGSYGAPWRPQVEGIRQNYNTLIRENYADKLVDLDALMRDPDNEDRMQDGMHTGDGVHPSVLGGKKMAAAILKKFAEIGL